MQRDFHGASRHIRTLFQSLMTTLKPKFDGTTDEGGASLSSALTDFRQACLELLQADLLRANNEDVDGLLWKAHTSVNDRYRGLLRKIDRKKEIVRWRVCAAEYKAFIKESQVFYRQYIRWLSEYGGIEILRQIAQNWRNGAANKPIVHPDEDTASVRVEVHDLATSLSHDCLLRLGDLSRWRYSARIDGDRGQPRDAVGYYELAEIIQPKSGAAQNQLAVLEAGDKHSFRALYHFYRSLAYEKPHDIASANLELEFKKISKLSDDELIRSCMPSDRNASIARLRTWFVRYMASSHSGTLLSQQNELESEIVGRIANGLGEDEAYDSTIERIILMSICAEWHARCQRVSRPTSENNRAYFTYLRFNVRTLLTLLQSTHAALNESFREDLGPNLSQENQAVDRLTKVTQRCLKLMHLHCFWLTARVADISSQSLEASNDPSMEFLVQDMWRTFTAILNQLVERFEVNKIEILDYLLHAEELCVGVVPVQSDHTAQSWYIDGRLKIRSSEAKKLLNEEKVLPIQHRLEMLARIRDIVTQGVWLAVEEESSQIALDATRFKYEDPTIATGTSTNRAAEPSEHITSGAEKSANTTGPHIPTAAEQFEGTINLNQMVENLLEDLPDPVDQMPETPHMSNFDDSVKISNSIHSLRLDGLENPVSGSPGGSKPRIHTPDSRDNLPSPSLPTFSSYSNRPSYYGGDETWQTRPTSGPTYAGVGRTLQARPDSRTESKGPYSRGREDALWGHAHHTSLPGFATNTQQRFGGLPMTPQASAAADGQSSSAVTGFNFAVNTPSTAVEYGGSLYGIPRVPINSAAVLGQTWISASQELLPSDPPSPHFPNSWRRNPADGQNR